VLVKDAVNDTIEPLSEWKELEPVDSEKVPLFEHHISGLSPRTSYEIEITAGNEMGWSEMNERFVFTTSDSKFISQSCNDDDVMTMMTVVMT